MWSRAQTPPLRPPTSDLPSDLPSVPLPHKLPVSHSRALHPAIERRHSEIGRPSLPPATTPSSTAPCRLQEPAQAQEQEQAQEPQQAEEQEPQERKERKKKKGASTQHADSTRLHTPPQRRRRRRRQVMRHAVSARRVFPTYLLPRSRICENLRDGEWRSLQISVAIARVGVV